LPNEQLFFKVPCMWCGTINHQKVPIVHKDDGMDFFCEYCHKVIIDFHYHEVGEGE